jgi:hypothetical protein
LGFACWLYNSRWYKLESILEIIESVVFFIICKSRSGFGRIFCTVFETVCASSLEMCKYSRFQCTRKIAQYFRFCRKIWWQSSKTFQKVNCVTCYLYKNVTNPEKNMLNK